MKGKGKKGKEREGKGNGGDEGKGRRRRIYDRIVRKWMGSNYQEMREAA